MTNIVEFLDNLILTNNTNNNGKNKQIVHCIDLLFNSNITSGGISKNQKIASILTHCFEQNKTIFNNLLPLTQRDIVSSFDIPIVCVPFIKKEISNWSGLSQKQWLSQHICGLLMNESYNTIFELLNDNDIIELLKTNIDTVQIILIKIFKIPKFEIQKAMIKKIESFMSDCLYSNPDLSSSIMQQQTYDYLKLTNFFEKHNIKIDLTTYINCYSNDLNLLKTFIIIIQKEIQQLSHKMLSNIFHQLITKRMFYHIEVLLNVISDKHDMIDVITHDLNAIIDNLNNSKLLLMLTNVSVQYVDMLEWSLKKGFNINTKKAFNCLSETNISYMMTNNWWKTYLYNKNFSCKITNNHDSIFNVINKIIVEKDVVFYVVMLYVDLMF